MQCPKCGNEGKLVHYMIGGDSWYCAQCKDDINPSPPAYPNQVLDMLDAGKLRAGSNKITFQSVAGTVAIIPSGQMVHLSDEECDAWLTLKQTLNTVTAFGGHHPTTVTWQGKIRDVSVK